MHFVVILGYEIKGRLKNLLANNPGCLDVSLQILLSSISKYDTLEKTD